MSIYSPDPLPRATLKQRFKNKTKPSLIFHSQPMHRSGVDTPGLALLGFGEEFIILGSMAEVSNGFRGLVKIVFTAIRLTFISVSS